MPLQLDVFMLILRILCIVLLYLFLMQVVIAISRDLSKARAGSQAPPPKAPSALGRLVVIASGPNNIVPPGTTFDLKPITTIGRNLTNTIHIPDNTVSHVHTYMHYHNGVWSVTDANSKNHTYVNDQQVFDSQALPARPGDEITVGFIKFKLITPEQRVR